MGAEIVNLNSNTVLRMPDIEMIGKMSRHEKYFFYRTCDLVSGNDNALRLNGTLVSVRDLADMLDRSVPIINGYISRLRQKKILEVVNIPGEGDGIVYNPDLVSKEVVIFSWVRDLFK